jgi:hypothetical protein
MISSTSARGHVEASGAKRELLRTRPVDHAAFRARAAPAAARKACKAHYQGPPPGFILTGGEASEDTATGTLMEIRVAAPTALLAERGHEGDRFGESLLLGRIRPMIPPPETVLPFESFLNPAAKHL